jgi:hypothetical protein
MSCCTHRVRIVIIHYSEILDYKTRNSVNNAVYWDVAPCRSYVNRSFGTATSSRWFLAREFSTLKMEAIRSSEMSVHIRSTGRHIPEKGIFL